MSIGGIPMRIVYQKRRLLVVCEITFNRLMCCERESVERVVMEDDNHIYTRENKYAKEDLIIK
jgi:hypothetical protein